MTNLKEQQGGEDRRQQKPPTIKTPTTWTNIDALNQLMTPVPLTDSDLQQELDFYASTQFRYNPGELSTNTASSNYFEAPQQRNNSNTFQSSTPQLNIPVDPNDYASSNLRNENNNNFSTSSSATDTNTTTATNSVNQQYNGNNGNSNKTMNSLSMLFEQHQQRQRQQQANNSGDGSLLLGHEPGVYGRTIAANQSSLALLNNNNMFSNHNTPINSSPNSPTVGVYDGIQQNYFDNSNQQSGPSNDRFATMFLSSNNATNNPNHSNTNLHSEEESGSKPTKKAKTNMSDDQFRFKKNTKQPLDYSLLSRHNMEQELLLSSSSSTSKAKNKPKEPAKRRASTAAAKKKQKQQELPSDDDEDNHDEGDEDEPVIGDGAQSYSSMGSNGSRSSLTKDDKRRRNTAASARFRIKKKMREQALQNTACEMTDKAKRMEQRVHELEREIKWLKALVVEKNEARIEQLVRERPPNSTAFPSPSSSSARVGANNGHQTNHSSSNNDEYDEDEDDEEYSNQY